MGLYVFFFLMIYFLDLISSSLYAANWSLSYGVNDLIVNNIQSLKKQPDGNSSHTPGFQIGIYGDNTLNTNTLLKQSGYVKLLLDIDLDGLDPDHIPIWFLGDYQAKVELFSLSGKASLNMLLDFYYKENTVSSIERQTKLFYGANIKKNHDNFKWELKASIGRYALGIDDDVPKTRGYNRKELNRVEMAYSVMGEGGFFIADDYTISLMAQTWQTGEQWLENQYTLQLNVDVGEWFMGSMLVVSIQHTEYNLDSYNQANIAVEEWLSVLPWNKDTLLQTYIIIPWE